MIGRLHHIVIDAPDPVALAAFYSALLGLPVTFSSADFVVVARDMTSAGVAFQRAPDLRAPHWPDPDRPQQMHLDVMVDDVVEAQPRVLALGARLLTVNPHGWRVYADPVGHPFCLVPRPSWAAPVTPQSSPAE